MSPTDRLLLVAYNVVWWVPVALPVLGVVSYQAGTIGFLAMSVVRAAINLYRNNVLTIAGAQRFPLRSP
ncbi:MAG: hypothetical protein GY929_16745 [Actinomycetia bacterium]|nr:hypothetical protein [Actinomycetes bacterium]